MSESSHASPEAVLVTAVRKNPLKRIGCTVILVLWFLLLLTPCFFFVIAAQGEIAIRLGDIPGQSFRIWLINEAHERGFAISRPIVHPNADNQAVCMETNVSFLLWQGEGKATQYCECFVHSIGTGEWTPSDGNLSQCSP